MAASYPLIIFFAACAVPLSWLVPRRFAFDAVALWTLMCLVLLSPFTAMWLAMIVLALPMLFAQRVLSRGIWIAGAGVVVVSGLVVSRILPIWGWIGVAYFSLRALHVLLDGWMGRIKVFGLRDSWQYFLFLPVIAAGPVNRLPHFQHQLRRRRFDAVQVFSGAERVGLGLILIFVLSGQVFFRFDIWLVKVTSAWPDFVSLWTGSAVAWVQLFVTFSGTTHVALGLALMMGLELEENFDRPWAARNLPEFWMRWHMTLTHWVRDYVFRPTVAMTRNPVAGLLLAMLVVGLWHAFSIYYLLWAMWQSLGIILSRIMVTRGPSMPGNSSAVLGPVFNLGWLSAALPVLALLGVEP
jgi:D-alanyl-lipoteichoic acid acyltransferase DltB (MBOAT superfamily)